MSEHELWNELGNLYFLSGSYNQAVNAYNKAIQRESGFGKPFSNLALILTKQAKYGDAIPLYKKSLDLLTDDAEKAITWNRLGNVYRQLKNYEDAVVAYQRADDLRSNIFKYGEQSNQMLYVSSESEFLLYEEVEKRQEHQNHSTDYMIDVEPEFDEALPEFAPVEAEILANEYQTKQNTPRDWEFASISEPVSMLPIDEVETPEPDFLEEETPTNLAISDVDVVSKAELTTKGADETIDQAISKNLLTEVIAQEQDGNVLSESEAASERRSAEIVSDEETPTILEADNRSEEDALEKDPTFSEPIAQSENTIEALAGDLPSALSEADVCLDSEAPARDDRPIVPVISAEEDVEELPDEFSTTTAETDFHPATEMSEEDTACVDSIDQIEYEPDKSAEHATELVESSSPIDAIPQTTKEEAQKTKNEIGTEEEKLTKQIEINPRNATTWEALGSLYKAAGRYEEAIQAFEQAVSIAPGAVSHYHNLGLVYSVSGNNKGAFNAFQKVLELDPNHSLTHASLGGYYKKIGLEELSQHHIGKAMKNIYESENEYNRACLEAICGNITQAIELLRTALEKKQTFVDWVLHDPDLDSLRYDEGFKQLISDFSN